MKKDVNKMNKIKIIKLENWVYHNTNYTEEELKEMVKELLSEYKKEKDYSDYRKIFGR